MKVNEKYEKKVHKILKTYDSVLVKCKNIPIQIDKNIIIASSMDGIVNAQIETRKPILYFKEDESMSFMIVDGTEIYVYIIKKYPEKECTVENIINNFDNIRNAFLKESISKLQNIMVGGKLEENNSPDNYLKNDNLLSFNNNQFLENMKIGNWTDIYKEKIDEKSEENNTQNNNFKNEGQNNINLNNEKQKDEINSNINNNCAEKDIENNNQDFNSSNEVSLALIKKRKKFNLFGLRNKSKKSAQRMRQRNKEAI